MSVTLTGTGAVLSVAASVGITTGDFSFGCWVRPRTDLNAWTDFFCAGSTAVDPTDYLWVGANTTGVELVTTLHIGAGAVGRGPYTMTMGDWYYIVVSRASSVFRLRVFDDSTSTTPLFDSSVANTDDLSPLDNFVIGQTFTGEPPDIDVEACRIHVGVEWSDAQCRSESQSYTPVTGGGSIYGNWKLRDIDADADGINDSGGASHHLSNANGVNGTARPNQLPAGGPVGDAGIYPKPSAPTLPAINGEYIDPTFGTRIVRITDATTAPDGVYLNSSAQDTMFNNDGTMFYLAQSGGPTHVYSLNRETAAVTDLGTLPSWVTPDGAAWDPLDSNRLFTMWMSSVDREVWQLDITVSPWAVAESVLFDFSEVPSGGYPYSRVQVSPDGRYVAIICSSFGSGDQMDHIVVRDRQTDTNHVVDTSARAGVMSLMHSMVMDTSGEYVIIESAPWGTSWVYNHLTDTFSRGITMAEGFGGHKAPGVMEIVHPGLDAGQWMLRSLVDVEDVAEILVYPRKGGIPNFYEDSHSSKMVGQSYLQTRYVADFPWRTLFEPHSGAIYQMPEYLATVEALDEPELVRFEGLPVTQVSEIPTAPNQWWYDAGADIMYLWLPGGEDPTSYTWSLCIFDWRPLMEEIIRVYHDGADWTWQRLAHHRSHVTNFTSTPRANFDPTGGFVLFKSNWDYTLFATGGASREDAFLLVVGDLPGPDLVTPMAVTLDEFSGVVDHVEQVVEEDGRYVEVHLLDLDLGVFDTEIPKGTVTTALFGAQAVDLGMTIPKILGNVVRSPLRYINDGTGSDQYDYAVTHGSGYTVTKVERKTGFADRQFETISASLYTVSAETYGAYTITRIRLTRRQTGFDGSFYDLYADVTGVAADRNPARAFRVLLADTAYGLSQTVDTASTDAAEAVLSGVGNLFVDGTLAEARPAREWLEQLFVMRGLRPGYGANGWALTVDQEQTTAALAIRSGPGPGEKNLLRAPRRAKTRPLQEQVKTYTLEYSYDHASETYLYPQSRTVASVGVDKTLSLDLVRNHTTARKVLVYLSRREQYGADQVDLVIGEEGRHIDIGDIVQVTYAPLGLSSADMEVRSIERGRGEHTILAVGWDPAIYDDDGGALPTDQSIDTSLVPPAASNLSIDIDSSGTYQASDGTTKAFVILEVDVPTSPAIAYARVDAKRSSQSVWNQGVAIISTQGVNIDSQVLGLEPNVAYDYRVVTVSGAGKEGSAVTITSQTTPEDTTAPATPVNLTVSSAATQIHMRVDPNTEDDLGEYEFDIRTASGGGGTEIAIFRKRSNAFVINPIATDASYVSAGTAVADATTQTLTLTAPTFTGAQAPNSILIASIIGLNNQVVTAPGGWFSAGEENNTAAMRVNNFWTPASGQSATSHNFTKPVDDNLLAFGVITLWRDVDLNVVLGTGGFKHNAVADAISYPNVDPGTLNRYLMVAIGYYADNATTAGAISGTNPTFANHVDQETATGGGASIFIASATSDGRATGNRTQATSSTTDAINTGYFFSLVPVAMQYGTTYYARARAYDRTGNVSAWGTAVAFVHKAVATKDIEADATSDLTVFSGSGSFAENGGLVTIITGTVTVLGPNSVLVVHSLVIGTQAADSAGLVWNTQMTNSYNSDNLQTIETSSASEVHTLMAVASTENVTPGNVTVTLKIQANGDSGANPTYVARLEILEIRR